MSGVWYGRCWFSSGVLREGRSASANLTGPHTSVGTPRIEPIGSHTQFPPHAHAVCDGAFPCGLPLSLLAFVPSPVLQRSTTRARPQHVLRAPRSRTDGFALRGLVRISVLLPEGEWPQVTSELNFEHANTFVFESNIITITPTLYKYPRKKKKFE